MMKTGQDIKFRRGDHKQLVFNVTLSDDVDSLANVEKIYWYVNDNLISGETFQASDPILDKEKTDMAIETSIVTIEITTAESKVIDSGTHWHELRIEDSAGNVSTLARGKFRIF